LASSTRWTSHPEVAAGGELAFWAERAHSFRANARGDIDPAWAKEVADDCRALLTSISSTSRRITDKRPNNFNFIGLMLKERSAGARHADYEDRHLPVRP